MLTRLFPFLFGTRIYTENGWRLLAPSSFLLGPGAVSYVDLALHLCVDTLIFGAIIFAAFQALRYAIRPR